MKETAVLIVNYNGLHYINDCLESLERQSFREFDIIIVDNNSTDDSIRLVEEKHPICKIIRNTQNSGFSGGNNVGLEYIINKGYRYIVLLNEDTICNEDMMGILLERYVDGAVFAPAIYQDREFRNLWYGCGGNFDIEKGKIVPVKGIITGVNEVQFLSGCCILISTELIRKHGGFDELFYMYWEDADFSIRLLNAGVKKYIISNAKLWHRGQRNEKGIYRNYYMIRNRLLLVGKNRSFFNTIPLKIIIEEIYHYIIVSQPEELSNLYAFKMALVDYIFRRFGKRETF